MASNPSLAQIRRYAEISRLARKQRTPAQIKFHRTYRSQFGPLTPAQRQRFRNLPPARPGGTHFQPVPSGSGGYVGKLREVLRGTPLAPYAGVIASVESRYGLPMGSIAGIAKAESSFGTAGSPTRGHNAWGWTNGGPPNFRSFPNWETAIRQYGRFLGENYGEDLRRGGPSAIEGRYVGYAAPQWSENVRSVMGRFGGGVPDVRGGGGGRQGGGRAGGAPRAPTTPQGRRVQAVGLALLIRSMRSPSGSRAREALPMLLAYLAENKGRDPVSTLNLEPVNPSRPGGTGRRSSGRIVGDDGLVLPATFLITHNTDGLAGYPAHDFMANPGTPVGAPMAGTIIRLSGSNTWRSGGFGGRSIYLRGKDGRVYFLTHFGPDLRVKVGDRVQQHQILGFVGDPTSGMAPHIHVGLHQ